MNFFNLLLFEYNPGQTLLHILMRELTANTHIIDSDTPETSNFQHI